VPAASRTLATVASCPARPGNGRFGVLSIIQGAQFSHSAGLLVPPKMTKMK
jgi:hypothetical protein